MKLHNLQLKTKHTRRGSILLLVLVVVMLLSFSMYSFSELSLVQYQATKSSLQEMRLRLAAESGIAVAADFVQHRHHLPNRSEGNQNAFEDIPIAAPINIEAVCSVLKQLPEPGQAPIYGLSDESARLNINGLELDLAKRQISRQRLTQIPGITNQIADAVLDWMDADDEPSDYGAESSWYASQFPSYQPRQGRFAALDELLLVRGVTFELLYGEDVDADGILDRGEDSNGDGILQAGWSDFLTIDSAESTLRSDGRPKINLNTTDLAKLYDVLESTFNKEIATYIIAFRMKGREDDDSRAQQLSEEERIADRTASAAKRLAAQLGNGSDEGGLQALTQGANRQVEVRNGITLTPTSPYQVESLVDLIGGLVRINVNSEDTLLKSPWQDDTASVRRAISQLDEHVTLTGEQRIRIRINVFEAPFAVLMTIPTMTESVAQGILSARADRSRVSQNRRMSQPRQRSIAELIERGLVDIAGLRQLAPFITDQGDVFRGVAIGQMTGEKRAVGIRFAIDGTYAQPRLMSLQDLPPMPLPTGRDGNQ